MGDIKYKLNMSDLANNIYGAGLADEGIAFEKMEQEIAALKALMKSGKLICPHCSSEFVASRHIGYYDKFDYWGCNCENLPVDKRNVFKGGYA
jgi:transposase-like protein